MGKFTGVLLASDYDNTLLNTETAFLSGGPAPVIPPRNLKALAYFMDNGGAFTVSTGRAVPSIRMFADDIPCNAPFVVANGAALYDFRTKSYAEMWTLPAPAPDRAADILARFPTTALELYDTLDVVHAVRPNQYTRLHERITRVPVEPHADLSEVPRPVLKMMFEDDHDILERIEAEVLARNWAADCEVFFTAKTLLEVTAKGATKGAMVLRLAERLGIARENVYCAGDEANDISMLQAAAEGFAPSNCAEPVRHCGATIVGDCASGAIADIVEILDRRY